MKTLHICPDHNFVENSRLIFERYFSGENIFIVNSNANKLNMIKNDADFIKIRLAEKNSINELDNICKQNNIKAIVLHGISVCEYPIVAVLKKKYKCKVYWIFWGFELYQLLGYENNYPLIDKKFSLFDRETYWLPNFISKILRKVTKNYLPKTVKKLLPYIDYFCFWNREDYNLLLKYYPSSIQFKFFAYEANYKDLMGSNMYPLKRTVSEKIMINHQASFYGNHNTVFNKIANIDKNNLFTKIVPLSYGNKIIKEKILKIGTELFGDKFHPILRYLPKDEYFNKINDVDIAIFGQRRQEASGNIIQMLKNGVKVFLRNDNNLLKYYRNQGYLIYSFEDDLLEIDDLTPLSMSEKEHNRKCYLRNMIFYDDFMPQFFD